MVLQAVVAAALLVLVGVLLAGAAPALIGYESFIVLSGSMAPALHVGDLAVVGPARPDQLAVRDIITYRTPARPNEIVTHRIVGIGRNAAGRLMFETKGDANDGVDQVEVDSQAVIGRVAYAVPMIGYLVDVAKQPAGKALMLGLPALLLLVDALVLKRIGWGNRAGLAVPATRLLPPTLGTPAVPAVPAVPATPYIAAVPPDRLIRLAWIAQRNGRSTEAHALLTQALGQDPSIEEAWVLLAECQPDAGARLTCLWEALAANPGSGLLRAAADEAARQVTAASAHADDAPAGLVYGHVAR